MKVYGGPWSFVIVAWACAVIGGFGFVLRYKRAAGDVAAAPASWPSDSALARSPDRSTLILFVHPRCACSRATLVELGHTLARVRGRVDATVVFVLPAGAPVGAGWEHGELRDLASTLPGVAVREDRGAVEAGRFGALTSGVALLYDPAGHLVFDGGITPLRGHEGNSFGQERIVALVTTGSADRADSPVFGCPLVDGNTPRREARDGR